MMRRLAFACALALIGCSTIERTSPGVMEKFDVVGPGAGATETVAIRNSGWSLFYCIPLLYGDVTWESEANDGNGDINGGVWLFRDKCNVSDCYETLVRLASQQDCDLTNVSLIDNSLVRLGFTGWADFFAGFVECNDVIVSGVLRPRPRTEGVQP